MTVRQKAEGHTVGCLSLAAAPSRVDSCRADSRSAALLQAVAEIAAATVIQSCWRRLQGAGLGAEHGAALCCRAHKERLSLGSRLAARGRRGRRRVVCARPRARPGGGRLPPPCGHLHPARLAQLRRGFLSLKRIGGVPVHVSR